MIGVAVGMTEAGDDKSKALLEELKSLFSASLHDVKLPVPLIKAMSGYYLETLQVESIDDVAKMDPLPPASIHVHSSTMLLQLRWINLLSFMSSGAMPVNGAKERYACVCLCVHVCVCEYRL